jgi:hypothetical protein
MRLLSFCIPLLFIGTVGCARLYPAVAVKTAGEDDPRKDAELSKKASKERDIPEDVRVVRGKIPEGLDIVDGKLVVLEGYDKRYSILGTVEGDYERRRGEAFWKNGYWTWKYDEGWRKGLCWPQAPLKALTLGIWSMFVPLAYPCFSVTGDEETRRINLNEALKKGGAAMGGNLVFVMGEGSLVTITVGDYGSSQSTTKAWSQHAFVLMDHGAEANPAGPTGSTDGDADASVGEDSATSSDSGDDSALE